MSIRTRLLGLTLLLPLLGAAPAHAAAATPAPTPVPTPAFDSTPGVVSVSPSHGSAAGGTTVSVTVRQGSSNPTILFGGQPATIVGSPFIGDDFEHAIATYRFTVTTPPGTAGQDVRVTSDALGAAATGTNLFHYDAPPTPDLPAKEGIESGPIPATGPLAGGTSVKLFMVGTIDPAAAVRFGAVTGPTTLIQPEHPICLQVVGIACPTWSITATTPPGVSPGPVPVTVSSKGANLGSVYAPGSHFGSSTNTFTYDGPVGPPAEDKKWDCSARWLVMGPWPTSVTVGGKPATTIDNDYNLYEINAPSPAFANGPSYPVVADGKLVGVYRNGCFAQYASPGVTIDGFAATATAQIGEGHEKTLDITAYGSDLLGGQVFLNDRPVDSVITANTAYHRYTVRFTVPADLPAGIVDLRLRQTDGTWIFGQTALSNDLEIVAKPSIVSVTPATGPLAGGGSVAVKLKGAFLVSPAITFGGVRAAAGRTEASTDTTDGTFGDETVTVTAPKGAATGATDLTVEGPASFDPTVLYTTTAAGGYTYQGTVPVNTPTITGIGGSGKTGLGGLILIRGSKLTPTKSIRVGSRTAIALYRSSTLVLAFVPSLAKGSYPVKLTTGAGTATSPVNYTFG